jgi:hypothetical protein
MNSKLSSGGIVKNRAVLSLTFLFLSNFGLLTALQAQEPFYKGKTVRQEPAGPLSNDRRNLAGRKIGRGDTGVNPPDRLDSGRYL